MDTDTSNHQEIKFLIGEGAFDEILVAHNELSDLVEKRNLEEKEDGSAGWTFEQITGHTGLLSPSQHQHEESSHDVKVP